jgi:hypothetical protein
MSVRIRYRVEVSVSSTTAEERDLGNLKYEILDDSQNDGGSWKTLLLAGTTATQIPLDRTSIVNFLMLKTNPKDPNQPPSVVNITKNSPTGEILVIQPLGTNKDGHLLLATSGITALYAANPGPTDMELTVVACGE